VGEFLVLQGAAIANYTWAIYGSIGVILSACYMLWMYQRVFYGEVNQEVRSHIADLGLREWSAIVPLIVMMVWMGVYSQSFLPPVGKNTARIIEQTNVNVPYRVRIDGGADRQSGCLVASAGGRLTAGRRLTACPTPGVRNAD
jgi:NADH-quinone oxidoreductase subunit M